MANSDPYKSCKHGSARSRDEPSASAKEQLTNCCLGLLNALETTKFENYPTLLLKITVLAMKFFALH